MSKQNQPGEKMDYKAAAESMMNETSETAPRPKVVPEQQQPKQHVEKRIGRKPEYAGRTKKEVRRIAVILELETYGAIQKALGGRNADLTQNKLINQAIKEFVGSDLVKQARNEMIDKGIIKGKRAK